MDNQVSQETRNTLYRVAVNELNQFLEACPYRTIYQYVVHYHRAIMPANNLEVALTPEAAEVSDISYQHTAKTWDELCELKEPELDYHLILQAIDMAIALFSRNAWLRCLRARALWALDHFPAAVEDLQQALRIQEGYPFALALLGETYYLMERIDEAIKMLSLVIEVKPDYPRAYYARALAFCVRAENKGYSREHKMLIYGNALKDIEHARSLSHARNVQIDSTGLSIQMKLRRL